MGVDVSNFRPPFFVHSDVIRALGVVAGNLTREELRHADAVCDAHLSFLERELGKENLIFPAFNYDFPKTRLLDLHHTPSQVGALTNFAIKSGRYVRTRTPVFSCLLGSADGSDLRNCTPFGAGSVFDDVFRRDGTIVFYGCGVDACTFVHYVETQFGPPFYRYDKSFTGTVVDGENTEPACATFHVRPRGLDVRYDWPHLEKLLQDQHALHSFRGTAEIRYVRAGDLSEIWGAALRDKPTGLLWQDSAECVTRAFLAIGRRFSIGDFE